jgi:hypothetical protein
VPSNRLFTVAGLIEMPGRDWSRDRVTQLSSTGDLPPLRWHGGYHAYTISQNWIEAVGLATSLELIPGVTDQFDAINGLIAMVGASNERRGGGERYCPIRRSHLALPRHRGAGALPVGSTVERGAPTVQLERQQRQHKNRECEGER